MQAEKQDEQWKAAVEQLDHLPPGISFHAGNTWKRLEHQLQPATAPSIIKSKPFYYAAACLVVAAVSAAVWLNRSTDKVPTAARPVINTPTVIQQAAVAPTKDIVIVPVKGKKGPVARFTDSAAQTPVYAVVDTIATAPLIIPTTPVNDIATQVKNITSTKTKAARKFVVIHINDLANNTPEIPVVAPESRRMVQQTEEIDNTTPPEAPKSRWFSKPKVVTTVSLTENP